MLALIPYPGFSRLRRRSPMSGEIDLSALLRSAEPRLVDGEFVFVSVASTDAAHALSPVCTFVEPEGITAICSPGKAIAAALPFGGTFRQITLTVHSSLQAVGFLAAVASLLARHGIACNAVSAFHHDHLFVPAKDADRALQALGELPKPAHD